MLRHVGQPSRRVRVAHEEALLGVHDHAQRALEAVVGEGREGVPDARVRPPVECHDELHQEVLREGAALLHGQRLEEDHGLNDGALVAALDPHDCRLALLAGLAALPVLQRGRRRLRVLAVVHRLLDQLQDLGDLLPLVHHGAGHLATSFHVERHEGLDAVDDLPRVDDGLLLVPALQELPLPEERHHALVEGLKRLADLVRELLRRHGAEELRGVDAPVVVAGVHGVHDRLQVDGAEGHLHVVAVAAQDHVVAALEDGVRVLAHPPHVVRLEEVVVRVELEALREHVDVDVGCEAQEADSAAIHLGHESLVLLVLRLDELGDEVLAVDLGDDLTLRVEHRGEIVVVLDFGHADVERRDDRRAAAGEHRGPPLGRAVGPVVGREGEQLCLLQRVEVVLEGEEQLVEGILTEAPWHEDHQVLELGHGRERRAKNLRHDAVLRLRDAAREPKGVRAVHARVLEACLEPLLPVGPRRRGRVVHLDRLVVQGGEPRDVLLVILDGYAHEARLDEGDKEVLPLDRRLQRTWSHPVEARKRLHTLVVDEHPVEHAAHGVDVIGICAAHEEGGLRGGQLH
mmetsp:Transcript_13937/g.41456  ORF Transcript_13937/g.41456 Transcript_13937/m.41456 type:complete len:573 (+) Transcript_13937:2991-4709(+)